MASSMSASLTTLAPPSTMTTPVLEPATMMLMSQRAQSWMGGLIRSSPSMRPTRTEAIGPANGMSDKWMAAEAPTIASMSGSFSWSIDSTVAITCVSQRYPLGNSGRMGRSISREVRVSFSLGRPISRRK